LHYPSIAATPRSPCEHLRDQNRQLGPTLGHFWTWGFSNIIDNTTRGVFAEFLVASALGVSDDVRRAWETFDLTTRWGTTVEVKSCAYLQSWAHANLSRITFGIGPSRAFDSETNTFSNEQRRQADVYVFCLLKHQDKATLDPLDVTQWEFYVLPTTVLNERCGAMKSISLKALLGLEPSRATYADLAATIDVVSR
jgi:hypothetical protein